jgi:protein-glutamine gamma-glutamyltransferase
MLKVETVVLSITYFVGAVIFVPVATQIRPAYSVWFLSLFLASVISDYNRRFYLPRWLLTVISLAAIGFAFYRLNVNDLATQMLETLIVLLGIKFLEKKKVRDYMQIYAICLLLLSSLGLLSLSVTFLTYYLLLILLMTVSAVLLTYFAEDPDLAFPKETVFKIVSKSLLIPLLAIPLTMLMFVILPRTQYPLFSFLNRSDKARVGFTDRVRLGGVSRIQEDAGAIMRVSMEEMDEQQLYWRGIVFEQFDGTAWGVSHKIGSASSRPSLRGKTVRQTIYLEPYGNIYLFCLDKPVFVSAKSLREYDTLTFVAPGHIETRLRYDVISVPSARIDQEDIDGERYLQVPSNLPVRVVKLVDSLVSGSGTDKDIQSLVRFLAGGDYRYSLTNLPVTDNPLETFLFETKRGNCEYFASALAVMLRIAGIPSRLVGGYKGGYYNRVGKYYLIPQNNAHVWVEAYTKSAGWSRLDPTPARAEGATALGTDSPFLKLRVFMDTANYYWYVFVINYNIERQFSLFLKVRSGLRKPSLKMSVTNRQLIIFFMIITALAGLILGLRAALVRRRVPREKRLLMSFLKRLENHGYQKTPGQGLEEFTSRIEDGGLRQRASAFVSEFQETYFKDQPFDGERLRRLKGIVDSL